MMLISISVAISQRDNQTAALSACACEPPLIDTYCTWLHGPLVRSGKLIWIHMLLIF